MPVLCQDWDSSHIIIEFDIIIYIKLLMILAHYTKAGQVN